MKKIAYLIQMMIVTAGTSPARSESGSASTAIDKKRQERLSAFLCAVQPRLRFKRGTRWEKKTCDRVSSVFIKEASRERLGVRTHDLLALAIAIQESDLVDTAIRDEGPEVARQDHGLMGIRYPSSFTTGYTVKQVRTIETNVRIGFDVLAHSKVKPAYRTTVQSYRQPDGRATHRATRVLDDHVTDHEYWAHYNAGPRLPKDKFRASYDRRVGAIYMALCEQFGEKSYEARVKASYEARDKRTREITGIIKDLVWMDPEAAATFTSTAYLSAPR